MRIVVSGANYKVNRAVIDIQRVLDKMNISYVILCTGSGRASTNSRTVLACYDNRLDLMKYMQYANVCVEVVEETPGAIFRYVSGVGQISFINETREFDVNEEISDFEDDEAYTMRMNKVGVIL